MADPIEALFQQRNVASGASRLELGAQSNSSFQELGLTNIPPFYKKRTTAFPMGS